MFLNSREAARLHVEAIISLPLSPISLARCMGRDGTAAEAAAAIEEW